MHVRFLKARAVIAGFVAAGVACAAAATAASAVRLAIVSGTPQTARAWVAEHADRFETKFDGALVVKTANVRKVRFRCVTRGCEFPAQDQADNVNRVNPSAYDVTTKNGQASIKLTIWTQTPQTVIVVAQPAERTTPQVRFVLNER